MANAGRTGRARAGLPLADRGAALAASLRSVRPAGRWTGWKPAAGRALGRWIIMCVIRSLPANGGARDGIGNGARGAVLPRSCCYRLMGLG